MTGASYLIGDRARVSGAFRTTAGAYIDPRTVTCKVRDPAGGESELVYGVAGAVVREDTGRYYVDVDLTMPGTWRVRFSSSGNFTAADEQALVVRRSAFGSP